MKGPKSSFWVIYTYRRLIVTNFQNQSMTDRQTDKQTNNYYNPCKVASYSSHSTSNYQQ